MPNKLTLLVTTTLAACAPEPTPDTEVATAFATLLADDTLRTTLLSRVAGRETNELALASFADQLPGLDAAALRLAAPDLELALSHDAPLVAYVDDASAESIDFVDGNGAITTVPLGVAPTAPFVVLRPHTLANLRPIEPEPELASATLNLYVREIRVSDDNEDGSDAEIYIRCKQGSGSWKRENLGAANDSEYYNLWDEHVMSVASPGAAILCELWEEDDFPNGDDFMGSATVDADTLALTDHDSCIFVSSPDDADLMFSKSRGTNQCPELAVFGFGCAEDCWGDFF
jgi:hypothetical protein